MNVVGSSKKTALILAAENGEKKRDLLVTVARVKFHEFMVIELILFHSFIGREEIVRMLLEKGANVDVESNDGTALMLAAYGG